MKIKNILVILSALLASACFVTDGPQRVDEAVRDFPITADSVSGGETASQTNESARTVSWLNYEPAVVELKGRLITKTYFGPPNYGENPKTDSKETLPLLQLSEPVNVRGRQGKDAGYEEAPVENVKEMQLVLTLEHKSLIGKMVVIKGTLFHGFTGHHHTDVLMNVQSIDRVMNH